MSQLPAGTHTTQVTHVSNGPRYYFAYGSNMNRRQMALRFEKAPSEIAFRTRAFLLGWKFLICRGGYATIVKTKEEDLKIGNDRTWGAVYILDDAEEARMDEYEGIASGLYEKIDVELYVCPRGREDEPQEKLQKIRGYSYRALIEEPGVINPPYIARMENACTDPDTALPQAYVAKYMRPELTRGLSAVRL